jgi:hypothetical protein
MSAKLRVSIASMNIKEDMMTKEKIPLNHVTVELCRNIEIARMFAVRFPVKRKTVASSVLASNHPATQHSAKVKNM